VETLALVTVIALAQVMVFQGRVARARNRFDVPGPAVSGHPMWERYNRVHLNTIENLVIFLPLLWICGLLFNAVAAGVLGVVFVAARAIYARGYLSEPPSRRAAGAWLTSLVLALLALGSLVGIGLRLTGSS
jgi:glutathione S-transferase